MSFRKGAGSASDHGNEARMIVGTGECNEQLFKPTRNKPQADFIACQLELLAIRASELADRVTIGEIAFLDAIDLAHSAAIWSGLVDAVGDDLVQKVLAASFARCGEARA